MKTLKNEKVLVFKVGERVRAGATIDKERSDGINDFQMYINVHDLRANVINRVKLWRSKIGHVGQAYSQRYEHNIEGRIFELKEFFNISEDELSK